MRTQKEIRAIARDLLLENFNKELSDKKEVLKAQKKAIGYSALAAGTPAKNECDDLAQQLEVLKAQRKKDIQLWKSATQTHALNAIIIAALQGLRDKWLYLDSGQKDIFRGLEEKLKEEKVTLEEFQAADETASLAGSVVSVATAAGMRLDDLDSHVDAERRKREAAEKALAEERAKLALIEEERRKAAERELQEARLQREAAEKRLEDEKTQREAAEKRLEDEKTQREADEEVRRIFLEKQETTKLQEEAEKREREEARRRREEEELKRNQEEAARLERERQEELRRKQEVSQVAAELSGVHKATPPRRAGRGKQIGEGAPAPQLLPGVSAPLPTVAAPGNHASDFRSVNAEGSAVITRDDGKKVPDDASSVQDMHGSQDRHFAPLKNEEGEEVRVRCCFCFWRKVSSEKRPLVGGADQKGYAPPHM